MDDLTDLVDALNLREMVMVGHSTGRRSRSPHQTARRMRVAKAELVSAVPPLMLKTTTSPKGTPLAVLDDIRKHVFANRAQFFKDFTLPFYAYN